MLSSTTLLPAVLAAGYVLLVLILAGRKHERLGVGTRRWLLFTLFAALVGMLVYLLPEDAHTNPHYQKFFVGELTRPSLGIIVMSLMIVFFATQTLHHLQFRSAPFWATIWLTWWGVQAASTLFRQETVLGQEGWLGKVYQPVVWPGVLAVGGWAVIGSVLLIAAFYAFYTAHLPEVANRALLWATIIPLVLLGTVLGTSGSDVLAEVGWIAQFVGLIGAVYSTLAYRVFDIRRALRRAAATVILTLITALLFFPPLLGAHKLTLDSQNVYVVMAVLALVAALIYLPLRLLLQGVINRLFGSRAQSAAQQLRQYSEDITGVVELDALVDVTMHTLSETLRVRRGGLILASEEGNDGLIVEPFPHGLGEIPDIRGQITGGSPIYRRLQESRAPLLQYDLDFGRAYVEAGPDERRFFQQMRMSAYAPVVVHNRLIGVLCCGAKSSDDPFTDHDLELLMTIANQAGVALRNARLVADLRRRETEQAELNRVLSTTKDQLEKLDGVKTDFITIASHELRTPLAQIRGYTDIMESMNEQGMLDQDQIEGMTQNLRKAADRLENLIGAMLDVSQLDVDAMDLRFAQTGIENVMRMAIEPLTESIKNRRLMLSARGLRGLPPIQADMQRLVQAFRNVILNAIKFTPDGGRIDISGQVQDDYIMVSIRDSGIGIDPAYHELIFEKFFRVQDPSLHSTGTTKFMGAGPGLGLTIARGVIEGHGGRIWVESEGCDPEQLPGSTFYIVLPLTPPAEAKRVLPFEASSISIKTIQDVFGPGVYEELLGGSPTLTKPPTE